MFEGMSPVINHLCSLCSDGDEPQLFCLGGGLMLLRLRLCCGKGFIELCAHLLLFRLQRLRRASPQTPTASTRQGSQWARAR
jgi:hypothetical protein